MIYFRPMDIRCERCNTEYEVDETLIGPQGTPVKCTTCGHTFNVFRPKAPIGSVSWVLRQTDGAERPFENLSVLRQWIVAGMVSPDDFIRQGNGPWIRLANMPEVHAAFEERGTWPHGLKGQEPMTKGPSSIPVPPARFTPAPGPYQRSSRPAAGMAGWQSGPIVPPPDSDPDLSQVPAVKEPGWEEGRVSSPPEPAWSDHPKVAPTRRVSEADFESFAPKKHWGIWIAFIIVFVFLGGALAFYFLNRPAAEAILKQLAGQKAVDQKKELKLKAEEYFLLDTDQSFVQAIRELENISGMKEGDAEALAQLSQVNATWAQYLRDAEIDKRAEAKAAEQKGDQAAAATATSEANRSAEEFKTHLQDASRFAEEAIKANSSNPRAIRALADSSRLEGDLVQASKMLDRLEGPFAYSADTKYLAGMILLDKDQDIPAALRYMTKALESDGLIRVRYRAARLLGILGKTAEAKLHLHGILNVNPAHNRARELMDRLDHGLPIVLALPKPEEVASAKPDAGMVETAAAPKHEAPAAASRPAAPSRTAEPGTGTKNPFGGGVDGMLDRAAKLQENGKSSEAIAIFKKVLEEEPSNSEALTGMGYAYMDQRSLGQAIDSFRRAISVNPRYGPALVGLGEAFYSKGDKELALEYYRKYLALNPSGSQAYMARRKVEELEKAGAGGSSGSASSPPPETINNIQHEEKVEPPPNAPISDKPAVNSEPPGLPPVRE